MLSPKVSVPPPVYTQQYGYGVIFKGCPFKATSCDKSKTTYETMAITAARLQGTLAHSYSSEGHMHCKPYPDSCGVQLGDFVK